MFLVWNRPTLRRMNVSRLRPHDLGASVPVDAVLDDLVICSVTDEQVSKIVARC